MRICYLADGGSIHTQRWCSHFNSLGHEIHVITFADIKIENVRVHFINVGPIKVEGGNWKTILSIFTVRKLIREIKPDILHAHYATSYGLIGALTGHHPYIVTVLGSDVLISPKQSKLYKLLVKYVLKKADLVMASAFFMREEIEALGVPAEKIHISVFGVDPRIFHMSGRKTEEEFVITSTRNFEPIYNIPMIIEAISIVKNFIPNLVFNLIGTGSLNKDIKKLVVNKNLGDVTNFHGRITQLRLAEILRESHIFLSTSYSDSNNVSLNEAMACGAFPIVTDITANRQWIIDGENGFLVPTDDVKALAEKILEMHNNYEFLQERATPINNEIILNKANWIKNMEIVEDKYLELAYG